MAIVIETFIICDGCGATYGTDMRHLKGMTHRKQYHNAGWVYTTNKDFCPNCRKKQKNGKFYKAVRKKRNKRA